MHPLCGKPSKLVWEGAIGMTMPMDFVALPPRGVSITTARIGVDKYELFTNLCINNQECYAIAFGKSEESVIDQLRGHICPAPARRDLHQGGGTAVQKMWHELDAVIDGIKEYSPKEILEDRALAGAVAEEKSYASGLAFSLALLLRPYYRSREDVLRQANKRWKMRQKQIPWEVTPGYNHFPSEPLAYARHNDDKRVVQAKAPRRAVKSAPTVPAKPSIREFSVAERLLIIDAAAAGTAVSDLAKMYDVPVERIQTMLPSPDDGTSSFENLLFDI